MSGSPPTIAQGRSCAGCTMCCKVLAIPELNKARDRWCTHCNIGNGCKIYDERPQTCSGFFCIYLLDAAVGEHWRPSHARIAAQSRSMVAVYVGDNLTIVLPDRDKFLGPTSEDQQLRFVTRPTPRGVEYDVELIDRRVST